MQRLNIRVWHFGPFSVSFVCLFVNFSAKLYSLYLKTSSPTSLRQSVNRSWSCSWVFSVFCFCFCWFFFFLHNYNWQVMKLLVKISAFFFFFKRKDQNRAALKNYRTQVLPCFTVWGLKMENYLRVSYLFVFLLFCLLLFFAAKKLRSFIPIHINSA